MKLYLSINDRCVQRDTIVDEEIRLTSIYNSLYYFLVRYLKSKGENSEVNIISFISKSIRERIISYDLTKYLIGNEKVVFEYTANKKITITNNSNGYVDISFSPELIRDFEGINLIFSGDNTNEVKLEKLKELVDTAKFCYLEYRRPYIIDSIRVISEDLIKNKSEDRWKNEYIFAVKKSRELRHKILWNLENMDDEGYIKELKDAIEDFMGVKFDDKLKWERVNAGEKSQYEMSKFINLNKPLYIIMMLCGMGDNLIIFEQPFRSCSKEDILKMKKIIEIANLNGNKVIMSNIHEAESTEECCDEKEVVAI